MTTPGDETKDTHEEPAAAVAAPVNPFERWDGFGLKEDLLKGIYAHGFEKPSPIQQKSIPILIANRDLLCQSQSGSGKTACFVISALQRIDLGSNATQALILANTHEIARQTFEVLNKLGQFMGRAGERGERAGGLRTHLLVGGTSVRDDCAALRRRPHVVVGCPGRVKHMLENRAFRPDAMRLVVLDEVDEMLTGTFVSVIRDIINFFDAKTQLAFFSATLNDPVRELSRVVLNDPETILLPTEEVPLQCIKQYFVSLNPPTEFRRTGEAEFRMKLDTLKDLFGMITVTQCIIYCNTVARVRRVHEELMKEDYNAACIHAELSKDEREETVCEFRKGKYKLLVSTDLVARGLDVQQVQLVINFDITQNPETYIHRIGRSGRYGRKGMAINFVTPGDVGAMRLIESVYRVDVEPLPQNFADGL